MEQRKGLLGWTDIFLLLIIFLNILDFFEIISSELDYAKKIISWTLLGYLLFRASPTKVFFGEQHKGMDTGIILAYFLLMIKELVWYANVALPDATSLQSFFSALVRHALPIEKVAFIIGIVTLIVIGLFVALRVPFHKRSIMGVLHEEGQPRRQRILERSLMTLLVFFGFFVMVFNMMMEWLAIAIDATLLLIALLFWSVFLIRHKVSMHRFLNNVGNIGSDFYEWFIDHFRYKETFLLGIVGLLVLHLLTDVGIFLIPYLTGIKDQLYLSAISLQYETVWHVFRLDWVHMETVWKQFSYVLVFMANIIGYVILFVSPAVVWQYLYHRRHPRLPRWLLVTFIGTLPAIGFASLFSMRRLHMPNLAGVNVQLQSLQGSPVVIIAVIIIVFIAVAWLLSKQPRVRSRLEQVWTATTVVFFASYIWKYFIDVASYQQDVVMSMIQTGMYFFAVVFFIFQALLIIFYAGGLILLLYELVHRTSHKRRS